MVTVRLLVPQCEHEEAGSLHDLGGLGTVMKDVIRRSKSGLPVVTTCLVYIARCAKMTLDFPVPEFRCPYMVWGGLSAATVA